MSLGFLKPKTPAQTPPTKLANINVTQAVLGIVLNVLMGMRRLSQSLIYYADFTAIPHVQSQAAGAGKGLGGGGGSTSTQTQYTYTAATLGALCAGVASGVVNVWDTKGRFQQTGVTETFTVPPGGGSYTVVNHGLYKLDRGVGFAQAFSQGVNDFGSPGPQTLSGTYQVPMTPAASPSPGQYSVNPATGTYSFHAADAGKVVSISYSYNLLQLNNTETASIPGSPFQILVDDSADFLQDTGVVFYPSGAKLQLITSGTPAAGQYKVSAGLYTFAAADTTKQVQISYVTNTTNSNSDAQTALNITFFPGTRGQTPWSYLTSRHPEAALGYTEMALVASQAMDLGSNGEMPNYQFEVAGPYQFGAGIVDCDPADCINALLQDPFFGIGFPGGNIGDWTQASDFWVANSFFISPLYTSQTSLGSSIGQILEAGMTAGFWSEGLFKLVPYGDTSAAGNGQIFVPDTQPIVDLDDTCFIGDGLVKSSRTPWQDAYNKVQIQWSNRLNGYNQEPLTEQDDAAIARFGLRTESAQSWDFICTQAAAAFAGNLRVKRLVNIRATYTFNLKSNFTFLEPMDLVTITVPELGWVKKPVRIQKIVDNPDQNGLAVTAEEFPWGTAQPTLYNKQTGVLGFTPSAGQADPGNTSALIFEASNRLGMQQGNILYIFVAGATPDWGGCTPYVSFDGVNYQQLDQIKKPARLGTLVNSLAAGSTDPDPSSFQVKMTSAGAVLPNMSSSDFDQLVSLCVLIDTTDDNPFELLAYKNATLVDKDTFQLDTLHRGRMGTPNSAHSAGETFARLDQASLVYQYDPSYYGKTISFKFASFNTLGGRPQPLSQCAVYSIVMNGSGPGAVDLNTGLYRPGIGNTQNGSGFPQFSFTAKPTEIDIAWAGLPLTRGTMPNPNQSDTTLDQTNLTGSVAVTGLSNLTPYWFYPYIDDKNPGAGIQFVTNAQIAGAVGTPAIAFTSANNNAAAFQQRNDHVPCAVPPLNISTLASGGGSSSGSGGGTQGSCPRGDMIVRRRTRRGGHEIVMVRDLRPGDWIRGKSDGKNCWVRVKAVSHKRRRDWVEVAFDCGEDVVVTPRHDWPTDRGIVLTCDLTAEHVFFLQRGRTFMNAWRRLREDAECIGIDIDTPEHQYYIGRNRPVVLTQNFLQGT